MPQGSYLLFQKAEATLLEEKSAKLFGITRVLDKYLDGTYDDLLKNNPKYAKQNFMKGSSTTKQNKLKALNEILTPFTDMIAESFPGVGVGYYSRELDAILTYGPSTYYSNRVGVSVDAEHIGRQCMAQQREIVAVGSMVRGEIMNCVRPLVRENQSIGFVWANETVEDIYKQIEQGARKIFFSTNIEPVLGLTGLLLLTSRFMVSAQPLKNQINNKLLPSTLKYMERYLNIFLNSLNLGIIVIDAGNRVVFINEEAKKILNLTTDYDLSSGKYSRQNYRSLFAKNGFEEISTIVKNFLSNKQEQHFFQKKITVPFMEKNHNSENNRELNLIVTSIRNDNSTKNTPGKEKIIGKVILFEDLARAKEEEKRLQRTNKLATLGEVAASIAHEIRNPLAIVLGSLQILPRRMDDRDFIFSFLRVATEELVRVNNSIESLLDFARFSQPSFLNIDINILLKNILEFFEMAAENQEIKIEKDFAPLPLVEADEKQIRQALMNIILNALQAMPSGGKLQIATRYQQGDKFIQLMIADTGCGIKPEDRPHVFDAFYSTKKKGTGLGLALVHRVIDEHRGIIEFKSEVNKGTSFYLHLPVKQINLNNW